MTTDRRVYHVASFGHLQAATEDIDIDQHDSTHADTCIIKTILILIINIVFLLLTQIVKTQQ